MLQCPIQVVLAAAAPPRSRREIELLAILAEQVSRINGRLGLHQEFEAGMKTENVNDDSRRIDYSCGDMK